MKKSKFLQISLFLIATMVSFTFCKKDSDDTTDKVTVKKISQAMTNNVVREGYAYDSKGVLLTKSIYDGSGIKTQDWKFTYESGQIVETDYDAKNRIFWKGYWILGSNGYCSKINCNDYDTVGNMGVPQSVDYAYDNAGYLILAVYKTDGVTDDIVTYTIVNGNCTEKKTVNGQGITTSDYQYEFESRLLKGYPDWEFNESYTFYGKANKNLCSGKTNLVYNTTWDYTYELDAGGYVVKRNVLYTDTNLNTSQWENTYVYLTF
jgi:hypothetical protein